MTDVRPASRDGYVIGIDFSTLSDELYAEYVRLHGHFGRGGSQVMHRLREPRDRVLAGRPEGSGQ